MITLTEKNQKGKSNEKADTVKKDAAAETSAAEILRLLREIHATVVLGKNGKEKHLTVRDRVLEAMADGEMRAPYQVWVQLRDQGFDFVEGTVASTMAALVLINKLSRVRQNLYQAPDTTPKT